MAPLSKAAWAIFALTWGSALAALDLNGDPVVNPLGKKDPSPIADPLTYYPDQHDCPLPCTDYSNIHAWTPYYSVGRLQRCKQPMLLQLSVTQSLTTSNNTLIRGCTLGDGSNARLMDTSSAEAPNVQIDENPKKSDNLLEKSLDVAPACRANGVEKEGTLSVSTVRGGDLSGSELVSFLASTQEYFDEDDNCDESFLFAHHRDLVASIYIGQGLGKKSIASAVKILSSRLRDEGNLGNRTIAELCGKNSKAEGVIGIAIDTNGDLPAVQEAALSWSQGKCVSGLGDSRQLSDGLDFKLFDVSDVGRNATRSNVKRAAPSKNADGTCATHIIQNGDTCSDLANRHGLTVADLERFNKGKTWAWTECKDMLLGYNMCLSEGNAPIPPPQAGTECGPMLPGTQQPSDSSINMAGLNPCPLKACCSNWGFCGPFAVHCDINAPSGGGPGAKLPGSQNTCISNCGNEIKQNSGPPATFERIGYYESWNLGRDCLWMQAKHANTDGTYTHMHWGFAEIDPKTWKVILTDPHKQWDQFKQLGLKRIVSFGGWAYSTEPATFNIIRQAIINNRETFAQNLAQFVKDEGIDGVDIDWEYPGAPDIMVDGKPIGQPGDGLYYLRFLTRLKQLLPNKSVSIAAPASYWYLKAFPIDEIAKVIDYIVYMTYDLHGQWDYGNVNAFDSCDSGKCIRSHVNLTETRNSLAIITKAGVANNKIFVGESSYGRSFNMAQNGCSGPMCEFTGTRTESYAAPGRCTGTGGYISNAEIFELIEAGVAEQFHDAGSNSDYITYDGDVVTYMTPVTKDTRRADWEKLNFAGSIDWAVDLQRFGSDDVNSINLPEAGEDGCRRGYDLNALTGGLCEFTCHYGYCPQTLCDCSIEGTVRPPPHGVETNMRGWDEDDLELNKLCKFACKYGHCPKHTCKEPEPQPDSHGLVSPYNQDDDYRAQARLENAGNCIIWENAAKRQEASTQCYGYCEPAILKAKKEDRVTNYACVGFAPASEGPIKWTTLPGQTARYVDGKCSCDNQLMNFFAENFLEALPALGQIGCYIVLSSLQFVLDVGASIVTGPAGRVAGSAYDALTVGAELASYTYPKDEDPAGAFGWWIKRECGDLSMVPDELKKVFDILSTVTSGTSTFKEPKYGKGQGRKDDDGNPIDQTGTRGPIRSGASASKPASSTCRKGDNGRSRGGYGKDTMVSSSCNNNGKWEMNTWVITSIRYGKDRTAVERECSKHWGQACHHYSSVENNNRQWAQLDCPDKSGVRKAPANGRRSPNRWRLLHDGGSSQSGIKAAQKTDWHNPPRPPGLECELDEWPPFYLVGKDHPAYINAGKNANGQMIRLIDSKMNGGAGSLVRGMCFPVSNLGDAEFMRAIQRAPKSTIMGKGKTHYMIEMSSRPYLTFTSWGHNTATHGLEDNACWVSSRAPRDPGYALLPYDPYYNGQAPPYNYRSKYDPPRNGGV